MKRLYITATVLGFAAILSACGPKKASEAAAPANDAATASRSMVAGRAPASADMSKMDMAPGTIMATGTGVVTAVDKTAGTITIKHGPVAAAGWPAMTMGFPVADPMMLEQVKAGDAVSFEFKTEGNQLTAIKKN